MTIEELRRICQEEKLKTNMGLVLLNRKISIYVTRLFIGMHVTADVVTMAGILAGVAGSLAFIVGEWRFNLVGVAFLYLSFLFDQVDGELARFHKKVSLSGVYLDEIRHLVIYGLTVFCLSFPAARDLGSRLPYLMGFVGAMALVIARVEERLPRLIFTEKVILRENFTGGEVSADREDPKGAGDDPSSAVGGGIVKAFACFIYGAAHILSHQVNIILFLLGVTLVDRFILRGKTITGSCTCQTLFFIVFTCIVPLAVLGAIISNYRGKKVDEECRRIAAALHKSREAGS